MFADDCALTARTFEDIQFIVEQLDFNSMQAFWPAHQSKEDRSALQPKPRSPLVPPPIWLTINHLFMWIHSVSW